MFRVKNVQNLTVVIHSLWGRQISIPAVRINANVGIRILNAHLQQEYQVKYINL